MTVLPSFVQLMASLGLETAQEPADANIPHPMASRPRSSSCSSSASSVQVPVVTITHQHRKSHSLSNAVELNIEESGKMPRRSTRYSPYPYGTLNRRESMPALSCSKQHLAPRVDHSSASSPEPLSPPASVIRTRPRGGSTAESVSTPISTYVRRKTPHASPISITFPQNYDEPFAVPSIPVLPVLLPQLKSFIHLDDSAGSSRRSSPSFSPVDLPDVKPPVESSPRSGYHHSGVRISSVWRSDLTEPAHNRFIAPIA